MQVTLYAPDVTCEHCIATIEKAVGTVEGATFVSGDPDGMSFIVEVESGGVLDAIAAATAAEGYPLGEAPAQHDHSSPDDPNWVPAYRVTATELGADVNYDCPCGCDAGFAFNRSQAEQHAESCCCGRQLLVAPAGAEAALRGDLEGNGYRFNLQTVTMPWGQPMEAAIAIPTSGSEG
jgi:copper chaperone CopZ